MMMKIDKRLRASSNDVPEISSKPLLNQKNAMYSLKSKDKAGGLALSTSLVPTP